MNNLLKSELYKLKRDKNLMAISIIVLLFGIINIIFHPVEHGILSLTSDFASIVEISSCILYGGMAIGSEFTNRTIQRSIVKGNSRLYIILSKGVSYFIGCAWLTLLSKLLCGGLYSVIYGWGEPFIFSEFFMVLNYTILSILFNLPIYSIVLFITFFIKDIGISIAISICSIGLIVAISQNALSYLAYCLAFNLGFPTETATMMFSMAIILIISMFTCTYFSFKKVDLK